MRSVSLVNLHLHNKIKYPSGLMKITNQCRSTSFIWRFWSSRIPTTLPQLKNYLVALLYIFIYQWVICFAMHACSVVLFCFPNRNPVNKLTNMTKENWVEATKTNDSYMNKENRLWLLLFIALFESRFTT